MKKIYSFFFLFIFIFYFNQIHAISLTTVPPYNAGNGAGGITFNISATNAVTINFLSTAFSSAPTGIDIWYKTTPINGAPTVNTANGWILAGSVASIVNINASPTPTLIPLNLNLSIPAGQVYGFCISIATGTVAYTGTSATPNFPDVFDANITIQTGVNIGYGGPAPNPPNTVRQINGTIDYTLGSTTSSSNPFSFPIPNFYAPDTVWLNSPVTLVNTSVNHTRVYWNLPKEANLQNGYFRTCFTNPSNIPNDTIPNRCNIDTAKYYDNFTYTFNRPGRWLVRLTAINAAKRDSLRDSVEKWIYVDTPSRKPQASFIAFKKIVGLNDFTNLYDLSNYGPTNWYWWYDPACNKCNSTLQGYGYNIIYPDYDPKPIFVARDPGVYDICLQAGNVRGMDTLCLKNYIAVVNSYNLCNANYATLTDTAGFVFGINGPAQAYDRAQITGACQGLLITPCADSVYIYVERMKMYPQDSIDIYNGTSASAPKLASLGGATLSDVPVANRFLQAGRQVFIRYRTQTGANPSGYDSAGFSIRWAIKTASYGRPTAKINLPDTLYSLAPLTYENQSTGALIQYSWDTDGNGTFGNPAQSPVLDSISAQPTRSFLITTASLRKICVAVYNCVGSDTACKNVLFLPIQSAPIARIGISKRTGFVTDTFRLFDKSLNGPKQWKWYVTLGGVPGTAKYNWMYGTNNTSKNPIIQFSQAKKYTIHLWVFNDRGTDSTLFIDYVDVGSYDQPNAINSGDATNGIGISRVAIVGSGLDTTFSSSNNYTPKSQYITGGNQIAYVYKGVSYQVILQRPNNNAAADFKAWIDFNRNGSFDASEEVLSSINSLNVLQTGGFTVKLDQVLGTMRMRVGVALSNASPALNPSAAYMGIFKDFDVAFSFDTVRPTIALKDLSRIETEINQTYVDPGVTAMDNLEGDISSRYETIGTVDITKTGPNYLRYIVRDLYGNVSDTIKRTVFVVLNQRGPKLTLLGGNIKMLVNTKYNEPGFTATDNLGKVITNLVQKSTELDTSIVGVYNIIYNITDADGFSVIRTRTVVVVDTLAPAIVSKQNPYVQQVNTVFDAMSKKVISITDNYQKPLRNSDISVIGEVNANNIGTYNLIYTAADSFNNQSKPYLLEVQVKDMIAPGITLKGANPMNLEVNDDFTDPGYILTDNYWPLNALSVKTKSTFDNKKLGPGSIEYTVTDGSGNTAIVTRSVNVVKKRKPVITLIGSPLLSIHRFENFVDPMVNIQDNYYATSVLQALLVRDSGNFSTQLPGTYLLNYYLTDPSGNSALSVSRQVEVLDDFTSVKELKAGEMKMYPVPTSNLLTVELSTKEHIQQVRVYDVFGKEISNVKVSIAGSKAELDMEGKAAGIYLLSIETESNNYAKKFNVVK